MNYARIYAEFIADRRSKEPVADFDRHHIVPKCVRCDSTSENMIRLSFPDHLFAHLLLAKIHGGKLAQAANLMLNRVRDTHGKLARRQYAWARAQHSREMAVAQKQRMTDPVLRARTSAALTGKPKSAEAIAKSAASRTGQKQRVSPDRLLGMRKHATKYLHKPEHWAATAEKRRGRHLSPEHIENIRLSRLGTTQPLEVREKINRSLIGRKLSPERCAAISARLYSEYANGTRQRSPVATKTLEAIAKHAAKLRGRKQTPEHCANKSSAITLWWAKRKAAALEQRA